MTDLSFRYLFEAASSGSMRNAAERIGVAVSSISRQIAQLERELGVALIEKNRRSIKLTEAGENIVDFHRNHMVERDSLLERIDALRGVRTGGVQIAVGEGFLGQIFNELCRDFLRTNPGITLSITVESTHDAVRRVLDDEVHAALVFQVPNEPKIRVRNAVPQPLLVVCSPDHELASRTSCTLAELARHQLALPPRGTRMRDIISAAEAKSGMWLKPALIANSIYTLREMARMGEIVTILPATSLLSDLRDKTLRAMPIVEPTLEVTEVAIITRLGRQLGHAPTRLLPLLEAKLRAAAL